MTYDLVYGDRAYSSWSLRGWLLFDHFGVPVRTHPARLYSDDLARVLADYPPARTVPTIRTPQGTVVSDTLAIAEELATRHSELRFWPRDPALRATARMFTAEMHSSFGTLRSDCPMNLRVAYNGFPVSRALLNDLARIEEIWDHARALLSTGPWLFGSYGTVDAFFAPVAARIAGYGLPVGDSAASYVAAHLAHPSFRRWRAMSLVDGPDQPVYAMGHARGDWPGPAPLHAKPVDAGTAENERCPYSGRPSEYFLTLKGRTFGFCNAFCRDKTAADPEAWPAFMALVQNVH